MGYVISIFSFLWRAQKAFLSFVLSLPGMILNAIFAISLAVKSMYDDIGGTVSLLIEFFDTAQEHLESMLEFISSQQYWGFFYDCFALDVLGRCFSLFIGLVCALIVLSVFEIFFQGVVVAVPFFIYKGIGKLVQTCSLGLSKPT